MATPSVVETSEGGRFLPPTQRPDGTWRKPRRIKEGYVPQEEVPLYESKGKQWAKSRSAYPVGTDPELIKADEAKLAAKNNATSGSKKKKKGASTQAVPNPGAFDDYDQPAKVKIVKQDQQTLNTSTKKAVISGGPNGNKNDGEANSPATTNEQQTVATEPAKRLRNLRKKLRDIENLEQKIKTKELKNPDKDQIEKVSRKEEVQAEISALELELSKVIIS